jgi:hypothetical protein
MEVSVFPEWPALGWLILGGGCGFLDVSFYLILVVADLVVDLPDAIIDINHSLRVWKIMISRQVARILFFLLIEAEVQKLGAQQQFVI